MRIPTSYTYYDLKHQGESGEKPAAIAQRHTLERAYDKAYDWRKFTIGIVKEPIRNYFKDNRGGLGLLAPVVLALSAAMGILASPILFYQKMKVQKYANQLLAQTPAVPLPAGKGAAKLVSLEPAQIDELLQLEIVNQEEADFLLEQHAEYTALREERTAAAALDDKQAQIAQLEDINNREAQFFADVKDAWSKLRKERKTEIDQLNRQLIQQAVARQFAIDQTGKIPKLERQIADLEEARSKAQTRYADALAVGKGHFVTTWRKRRYDQLSNKLDIKRQQLEELQQPAATRVVKNSQLVATTIEQICKLDFFLGQRVSRRDMNYRWSNGVLVNPQDGSFVDRIDSDWGWSKAYGPGTEIVPKKKQ